MPTSSVRRRCISPRYGAAVREKVWRNLSRRRCLTSFFPLDPTVEALRVLLEHGADPNAPNRIAGMTPLHCAVRGTFQSFRESLPKRLTCIRLLLEAGADPTLEDLKGKDALNCVEDVMKEAQIRGLGNIESEAKEMRAVLEGGVTKSMLLQCVDERDVDGVRGRLSDASRGEWSKGLVSAVNAIQTLMDESGDEKSFASVVKIM